MDQKIVTSFHYSWSTLRVGCVLLLVGFGVVCFAIEAESQVFRIEPSILLSEEYNDNVFLLRNGDRDKLDAIITRFAPAVRARYTTPFWDWDINYTYNFYYYYFTRHTDQPNQDQAHTLNARNRTELIKNVLFLEVRDEYSRVSQDIVVNYTQQSPTANQVDQNVFTVNPYAIARPFTNTRTLVGYMYQETRYLNASSGSQGENINRYDNIGYSEVGADLLSGLTVTTGARYTDGRNNVQNYGQLDVYAGPQYVYAENCQVYARAGRSWFHFGTNPSTGENLSDMEYWFWDGGVSHRISTTTLALGARRSVAQDPQRAVTLQDQYTASITKTEPRYVLTISGGWYEYWDAVNDERLLTSEQGQGSILYRFTPLTTGTIGGGYQVVHDSTAGEGVTKITLANLRLDHRLFEKGVLALEYRFANSHSYAVSANNYSNNRCFIEYRHTF